MRLNDTHDPRRSSWVDSANDPDSDFRIQNLPYGVFSVGAERHVGVAIGDQILDLTVLEDAGLLTPGGADRAFDQGTLNPFMALPQATWSQTRATIATLLDVATPDLRDNADLRRRALVRQSGAQLHLPIHIRSFTDFYASKDHATNVGSMFRDPDKALLPNWLHMPVGYNGRASTVVVSGTDIHRPLGQLKAPEDAMPRLAPSAKLDMELELGAIVGTPNQMGQPVTTAQAFDMIFGYVLLNDWSARDIQVWEYQPLGPFQSKAFGTTISPWIVTREALEPFRTLPPKRVNPLLPYLAEDAPNAYDIHLTADLAPPGQPATTITRTNARHLYYTPAQQLAHHALSGCAMCTGDLLGSGTISGPSRDNSGSLLELTWNGRDPLTVAGGTRTFVQDGDTLNLQGHCDGPYHLGFGACTGTLLPAPIIEDWA